jgi:hypothetical protein
VKAYHKVLQAFVTNAKLELTVLTTLQVGFVLRAVVVVVVEVAALCGIGARNICAA